VGLLMCLHLNLGSPTRGLTLKISDIQTCLVGNLGALFMIFTGGNQNE